MHGLENMCIIYFFVEFKIKSYVLKHWLCGWYIYHNISFMFVGDWWRSGGKRMPKILPNWTAFGGFLKKKTRRWWSLVWGLPYFLSILVRFVSLATNLARYYCFSGNQGWWGYVLPTLELSPQFDISTTISCRCSWERRQWSLECWQKKKTALHVFKKKKKCSVRVLWPECGL